MVKYTLPAWLQQKCHIVTLRASQTLYPSQYPPSLLEGIHHAFNDCLFKFLESTTTSKIMCFLLRGAYISIFKAFQTP